jgi:hypothetical protein
MHYDGEGNVLIGSGSWTDAYKAVPRGLLSWPERIRMVITGEQRLMSVLTGARIWL